MNSCIYYSTNLVTIAIAQRHNILYLANHEHFVLVINLVTTAYVSWECCKKIGTLPIGIKYRIRRIVIFHRFVYGRKASSTALRKV